MWSWGLLGGLPWAWFDLCAGLGHSCLHFGVTENLENLLDTVCFPKGLDFGDKFDFHTVFLRYGFHVGADLTSQ